MPRFVLSCALLCVAGAVPARAQQAGDVVLQVPKFDNQDKFRTALRDDAAAPKDILDSCDTAARHYVYRLTTVYRPSERTTLPKVPNRMAQVAREVETWFREVYGAEAKNAAIQQQVGKRAAAALETILKNPQQLPIVRVNAARLLAQLAALSGVEETADPCVGVVTGEYFKKDAGGEKEVDGVRYWALRGLSNLLARTNGTAGVKDAKRRAAILAALVQFIERPSPLSKVAKPEEVEGVRMVRREAVRALAQARDPGAAGPDSHAALTLLRVAARDKGLVPEPRTDELVEAVVGLCQMRPDKDIQPGYVGYHVARCFRELARRYQGRGQIKKPEPWKVHGARLVDALKAFQAAHPTDATVRQAATLAIPVVTDIEKGVPPGGAAGRLAAWVEGTTPSQTSVYKSDPKSTVTPAEDSGGGS